MRAKVQYHVRPAPAAPEGLLIAGRGATRVCPRCKHRVQTLFCLNSEPAAAVCSECALKHIRGTSKVLTAVAEPQGLEVRNC